MITIDTTNRIVLNGQRLNLAVAQKADGTVVYTPESRLSNQAYKEHAMPHKRYSLAHDAPASGVAGRAQFVTDIRALIEALPKIVKSISLVQFHGEGNNGNWGARMRFEDGSELFAGAGAGYTLAQAQAVIRANPDNSGALHPITRERIYAYLPLPAGVTVKA